MQILDNCYSLFRLHRFHQVAATCMMFPECSMNHLQLKILCLNRKDKMTLEKFGTKLQNLFLRVTKRDVQSELFIVVNVTTSQHVLLLISTSILQKNVAHPGQKNSRKSISSPNLLMNNPRDYTERKITTRKKVSETKSVDVEQVMREIDDENCEEEL